MIRSPPNRLRRPRAGPPGAAQGQGPRGGARRAPAGGRRGCARWPSLVPPDPARQKRVYMQVMLSSHHTTNAHFSRSTHDLMMISWIAHHPRYPAQVTASQQRAALLLHDAEVGDDGPDDEKDEEQAS